MYEFYDLEFHVRINTAMGIRWIILIKKIPRISTRKSKVCKYLLIIMYLWQRKIAILNKRLTWHSYLRKSQSRRTGRTSWRDTSRSLEKIKQKLNLKTMDAIKIPLPPWKQICRRVAADKDFALEHPIIPTTWSKTSIKDEDPWIKKLLCWNRMSLSGFQDTSKYM